MQNLKNTLFLDLTKNQKSSLFGFMRAFVKKHAEKSTDDILSLFIEDENYYYEQNNPHFEWIINEFEKEKFLKELKKLIDDNKLLLKMKEAQKPFIEKQKALAKEQRKKAAQYKLSKEPATKKQLYYYGKLCEKYKLEKTALDGLSKLDLKNMIGKIIDEHDKGIKEIGSGKSIY